MKLSVANILGNRDLVKPLKFILVGILNTVIGYGVFFILSYFFYYIIALIIAHIIGVTNSFVWNKYWTFGTRKNYLREFIKFNLVYLLVLLANIAILGFLVDYLKFDPRLCQMIVLPVVTIISYFGHRSWSFSTLGKTVPAEPDQPHG